MVQKLGHMGLFHIFGSNTVNRLISFVSNSVVIRTLSKEQYGLFGSAYNVFNLVGLVNGFGMANAMLLYCSEDRTEQEKSTIYQYTLKAGFLASMLLSIGMVLYGIYGKTGIEGNSRYIVFLSALPMLDYLQLYVLSFLRTRRENKTYARLMTFNTCTRFVFDFLGALLGRISGLILGRYLVYGVTILAGAAMCADKYRGPGKRCITEELKKVLWNYAVKTGGTSALNQIVYLVDIALISYLISDAAVVARYKVAAMIPEALNIIPQSTMVTFLPYFSARKSDGDWVAKNCKRLFAGALILNFFISLVLCAGAPVFLRIIGGVQYLDGARCFQILSISYFFLATFRLFSTNLLAVFHKVTFNFAISVFTGTSNILLDYFLILKYGSIGAAWATLITVVLASLCSFPYLIYVIKNRQFGD